MIESIDETTCDGCNVCIDSCPTGVIRLVEGDEPWSTTKWRAKISTPTTVIPVGCAQSIATWTRSLSATH
ncbi:4Fe-4S binding protein [Mycolicibacterium sp. SCSIO 43805]|uniref:4Fe-4S binding protein n=1 Tax=Mycolicibacterium sp. SCSIO 43805 TaxID=3378074 RepID=UPI003AB1923F